MVTTSSIWQQIWVLFYHLVTQSRPVMPHWWRIRAHTVAGAASAAGNWGRGKPELWEEDVCTDQSYRYSAQVLRQWWQSQLYMLGNVWGCGVWVPPGATACWVCRASSWPSAAHQGVFGELTDGNLVQWHSTTCQKSVWNAKWVVGEGSHVALGVSPLTSVLDQHRKEANFTKLLLVNCLL